jgi:hypothetical protein
LFFMLVLMLGLIALTGCSSENNEHQRLVAEADLVNSGGPLVIAAVNVGDPTDLTDDFVPIETANVMFSARPLNDTMVIPENGTYSTFNVTHYSLTWTPSATAPAALTDYNVERGLFTVSIPVNDEIEAGVLVGNLAMKAEPWFQAMYNGVIPPFTAELSLVFYGHESGSEHEVAVPAGTTVMFIPEIIEN